MTNWTKQEEEKVIQLSEQGYTIEEIATQLRRSYKSVSHRHADLMRGQPIMTPTSKTLQTSSEKVDPSVIINNYLRDKLSHTRPYISSKQNKVDKKGDTLVIHLTDLHAGKIVKDQDGNTIYDESVFRSRIDRLCEQVLKLLDNNISKGVPITDVAIISTGDLANGEGIYETQAYEQELAPPKQVMLVVDVITKLIISLIDRKLPVKFYGVKGNHGRTGKDTDTTSNWDLQIYMILDFWARLVLKNPKLQINYAETDYLTFTMRGHNYMIRHIAPIQADSPGGRVKFGQWAKMYNAEGIVYGHFHHFGLFDCDKVRIFRGGCLVGGDSLSEQMATISEPIQLVWGVNEQRVMTFFYAVDLNEEKKK